MSHSKRKNSHFVLRYAKTCVKVISKSSYALLRYEKHYHQRKLDTFHMEANECHWRRTNCFDERKNSQSFYSSMVENDLCQFYRSFNWSDEVHFNVIFPMPTNKKLQLYEITCQNKDKEQKKNHFHFGPILARYFSIVGIRCIYIFIIFSYFSLPKNHVPKYFYYFVIIWKIIMGVHDSKSKPCHYQPFCYV